MVSFIKCTLHRKMFVKVKDVTSCINFVPRAAFDEMNEIRSELNTYKVGFI